MRLFRSASPTRGLRLAKLVGSGKMTEKQFADAMLHEGPMAIELPLNTAPGEI